MGNPSTVRWECTFKVPRKPFWKGDPHMLVLSRKLHEKIVFPGLGITVHVVAVKPGVVRLGIEAPLDVAVLRSELQERDAAMRPQRHPADQPLVCVHHD